MLVLEALDEIGGGIRTAELTLPGFAHDVCSACHPMGILSPYLSYRSRWPSTGSSGSSRRRPWRTRSTTAPQ